MRDYFICIIIACLFFSGKNPTTITYHSNLPLIILDTISCETENDINLLARLGFAESGVESELSKLATMSVVINRSDHKNISIGETIFAKGQFDCLNHKNWVIEYDNLKYEELAYRVICGEYESNYYWYANPDISTDTTFIKWLTKGKGNYIDNQYFKEYEHL